MNLKSTKDVPITISLNGSAQNEPHCPDSEELDPHMTEKILYILMKYNISLQGYHELSMIVDGLPRSSKVVYLNNIMLVI